MRQFTVAASLVAMLLTIPPYLPARFDRPGTSASPIELRISGPHLIHRGDRLKFDVAFINRSGEPLALRFPRLFDDPTRFTWSITDTSGRRLSPRIYEGPPVMICPVTSPISDLDIFVLQPGERIEYSGAGDPSEDYVFRGKGFYRVILTYTLAPDQHVEIARYRG